MIDEAETKITIRLSCTVSYGGYTVSMKRNGNHRLKWWRMSFFNLCEMISNIFSLGFSFIAIKEYIIYKKKNQANHKNIFKAIQMLGKIMPSIYFMLFQFCTEEHERGHIIMQLHRMKDNPYLFCNQECLEFQTKHLLCCFLTNILLHFCYKKLPLN